MLRKSETEVLSIEIAIDPKKINTLTLESFLLNALIKQELGKENFHLLSNKPSENIIELRRTDIPKEFLDDALLQKHQGDFEIKINLQNDIVARLRETPLGDDLYRYEILASPQIDYIHFEPIKRNPIDPKNLKPNGIILLPTDKYKNIHGSHYYLWDAYYVNANQKLIKLPNENWLRNRPLYDTSVALSKDEEEQYKTYFLSTFFPTLGMTDKTKVYLTVGTLAPDEQNPNYLITKEKNRAMRRSFVEDISNKEEKQKKLLHEKSIGKKAGSHIKSPVFQAKEKAFYSAMELLEGDTVDNFLKKENISTDELIDLCIELFWQVQKLHERSIIHGDIKSENTVIQELGSSIKVKVFDFDLSINLGQGNLFGGTPLYEAPEVFLKTNGISIASDIYSLGIFFTEIFKLPWFKKIDVNNFWERLDPSFVIPFDATDFSQTDLSIAHQKIFEKIIRIMTSYQPINRGLLQDRIDELEKTRMERRRDKITDRDIRQAVSLAHVAGKVARVALTQQENRQLDKIKSIIKRALDKFRENEEAVKEFIAMVRIEAIKDCKTKDAIQKTVNRILETFSKNRDKLFEIRQKILSYNDNIHPNSTQIKNLLQPIENAIQYAEMAVDKHNRYGVTVDEIVLVNKKMEKDIQKLQSQLLNLTFTTQQSPLLSAFFKLSSMKDQPLQDLLKSIIDDSLSHLEKDTSISLTPRQEKNLTTSMELMANTKPSNVAPIPNGKEEEKDEHVKPEQTDISNPPTDLDQFKKLLKRAIANYLAETLVDNLKTGDRALSLRRQKNINNLLTKINAAQNIGELYTTTKSYVDTEIRGSVFDVTGFFSGSQLRKNVLVVLKNYQNHPEVLEVTQTNKPSK